MGTGIYFGSYESSKYLLSNLAPPGPLTYAISGASCGIIAWCVVFPIDTAKVPPPTTLFSSGVVDNFCRALCNGTY